MKPPKKKSFARRLRAMFRRNPDRFLKKVSGVIHVGANTGAERDKYREHGLRVVWVEPIPEVFQTLQANLAGYSEQRAVQALVTDKENSEYAFNVSSNDGKSSSILDLKLHKEIWPKVSYTRTIQLCSTTLAALIEREQIKLAEYDALIMDTQGSELLVLKGAEPLLPQFRFIKTEVADFEAYAGCCQLRDIEEFLTARGFREFSRQKFARRKAGGSYYDVVYERNARD